MKGISSNRYGELPVLTVMGSWTSLSFFNRRTKDYTLRPLDININIPNVEEVKAHVKKHQVAYSFGAGFVVTGVTYLVMRSALLHIGSSVTGTAGSCVTGTSESAAIHNVVSGKNNVLNSTSYILSNRQGPPSWVVRCLETNEIFTSQRAASFAKDINERILSQHLNGGLENVNGLHFERICMAA